MKTKRISQALQASATLLTSQILTRASSVLAAHRYGWKCILFSALLVCGAVTPLKSRAEVVTYTQSFLVKNTFSGAFGASSSTNLLDFEIISLPRFDSALGNLQQVSITFNSSVQTNSLAGLASDDTLEGDFIPFPPFIINERNDAYFNATMSTALSLQLFDPSSSAATRNLPSNSIGCYVSGSLGLFCQDRYDGSFDDPFNSALVIGLLGLDAFMGSDPINLLATLSNGLSGNCDVDDRGDACLISARVNWLGSVTVWYNYSLLDTSGGGVGGGDAGGGGSGTVPEPASLALVLVALGLGGLSARRKC